jgi:hypothetical protein
MATAIVYSFVLSDNQPDFQLGGCRSVSGYVTADFLFEFENSTFVDPIVLANLAATGIHPIGIYVAFCCIFTANAPPHPLTNRRTGLGEGFVFGMRVFTVVMYQLSRVHTAPIIVPNMVFGIPASMNGNLTLSFEVHSNLGPGMTYYPWAALSSNVSVDQSPLPITGKLDFWDKGMQKRGWEHLIMSIGAVPDSMHMNKALGFPDAYGVVPILADLLDAVPPTVALDLDIAPLHDAMVVWPLLLLSLSLSLPPIHAPTRIHWGNVCGSGDKPGVNTWSMQKAITGLGALDIDFSRVLPTDVIGRLAASNVTTDKINNIVGTISRAVNLTHLAEDAFNLLTEPSTPSRCPYGATIRGMAQCLDDLIREAHQNATDQGSNGPFSLGQLSVSNQVDSALKFIGLKVDIILNIDLVESVNVLLRDVCVPQQQPAHSGLSAIWTQKAI